MRKQNKLFLWPLYFDISISRKKGRRVPKNLAVSSPKMDDLQKAARLVGLDPKVVYDATHPNCPWLKKGLLIVPKTESKNKILKKIAKELSEIRK
jgi:signal recognition particle subunit SRP19